MRVKDYKMFVGPGWGAILNGLDAELNDVDVFQVKEKFGGLRVYLGSIPTAGQREAIRKAEAASYVTCEECGRQGTLREELRWIRTLCDEHVKGKK